MDLLQFLLCACPPGAEIADIPTDDCIQRVGQLVRFGVQRTKTSGAINWITIASASPAVLATWTALKAASDSTKVQFSPLINEAVNEDGGPREYGGGNQTVGGIPLILGTNPSTFTGKFLDITQVIATAIESYMCEKELSIFLVNEHQQIIGLTDSTSTPLKFRGIPIKSFYISNKVFGGYESPDMNNFSWRFLPGWSNNLYIVDPTDFDPITEL